MDSDSVIPDVALKELNAAKSSGFSILKLGTDQRTAVRPNGLQCKYCTRIDPVFMYKANNHVS
jgi:hypothetical protein